MMSTARYAYSLAYSRLVAGFEGEGGSQGAWSISKTDAGLNARASKYSAKHFPASKAAARQ